MFDEDDTFTEAPPAGLYRLPRSSIGMFSRAPLIRLLNSAWRGVAEVSAVAAASCGTVEGDVPGGGVAAEPPGWFGSPFSPSRIRLRCLDSFSNVLPRFFSADSTDARQMSTLRADRLGMNRSLEYWDEMKHGEEHALPLPPPPPPPPTLPLLPRRDAVLGGVRSSGGERSPPNPPPPPGRFLGVVAGRRAFVGESGLPGRDLVGERHDMLLVTIVPPCDVGQCNNTIHATLQRLRYGASCCNSREARCLQLLQEEMRAKTRTHD